MGDRSGRGPARDDDPGEGSLAWDWVGSLAVITLTAVAVGGAAVATPGHLDCRPYTPFGVLLSCPWARAFVVNAAALFGLLAVAITLGGLLVGVVRLAVRRRDG